MSINNSIEAVNNDFVRTRAINKLAGLKKRIRIIPGGTSAGKTYGILPLLINKAIKTPNIEISVVSESIPHLKKGTMKDFLKIMKSTGRFVRRQWHGTDFKYTFSNGSYIEFFSADQEDKVRGPRRHILFLNEANNISFDTYHQLAIRTSGIIWLDFNPSLEFWAHTELMDDEDADWCTLTYKDNIGLRGEATLAPAIVKDIEKAKKKAFYNPDKKDLFNKTNIKNGYWANWWKVYGLGQLGQLEGVVFTNWKKIKGVPFEAKFLGTAIDFGYTNDPTAIIDIYEYNGKIIWDEVTYQTGLKNSDIANLLKSQGKTINTTGVADCAEPKSIDEINDYGFNIIATEKGADSIKFGIDLIQQEEFYVTERSTNLIKELRMYSWDQDKTGKYLNKPIDAFNHAIDAARYFYMMFIARKNIVDRTAEQRAWEKAKALMT